MTQGTRDIPVRLDVNTLQKSACVELECDEE